MTRRAACGLALLAACATRTPPPAPPPQVPAYTAEQAVHEVDRRDRAVHSLRARFTATVTSAADKRTVSGVVLLTRPDRLRFRLALPIGFTVFDYLQISDRAWLALPMGGSDKVIEYATASVPRMFDRFLSGTPLSRCDLEHADSSAASVACAKCVGDCRPVRAFRIRLADAAVEEDAVLSDDQPVSITRYQDYRAVDGAYLPYRIEIADLRPAQQHTVEVTIERYEVNPALDASLFTPSAGSEPVRAP